MNTDQLTLKQAEQLLYELMNKSEHAERMHVLYRFLRSGEVHAAAQSVR